MKGEKNTLIEGRGCIFREEVVSGHPLKWGGRKHNWVSTKSGLCRDQDYAEFGWWIPCVAADRLVSTAHSHRASRKERRRSRA